LTATASRSVNVTDDDTQAPIITLGGSTGAQTDGQDQTFTWLVTDADSGLGSVSVSITRDGVEIFTSTDASGTFPFDTYGLGTYEINVTAPDAEADRADDAMTSSASRSVIVSDDDTTPPLIVLGGSTGAETDGQPQSFTWNISDAGSGLGALSVVITRNGSTIFSTTNLADAVGSFNFDSFGL